MSCPASGSPYEEIGKICCDGGGLQSLIMYRHRLSQIQRLQQSCPISLCPCGVSGVIDGQYKLLIKIMLS